MKTVLFYILSIITSFYIGWNFGENWMPDFYYNYLHGHQDIDWIILTGQWLCGIFAVIIMCVFIYYAVHKFSILDFVLAHIFLAVFGGILALGAKIFMKFVYGAIVLLLVAGFLWHWFIDEIQN